MGASCAWNCVCVMNTAALDTCRCWLAGTCVISSAPLESTANTVPVSVCVWVWVCSMLRLCLAKLCHAVCALLHGVDGALREDA